MTPDPVCTLLDQALNALDAALSELGNRGSDSITVRMAADNVERALLMLRGGQEEEGDADIPGPTSA